MAFESTKVGKESKEKVSNKPHCSNRAITEDATALNLPHSGQEHDSSQPKWREALGSVL